MATRTEAPTAPAAARSLRDELDDVQLEEGDPEGAAPVDGADGEPPQPDPDAPAEDEELDPTDQLDPEGDPEDQTPAAETVAWQPPEGGEPFTFRVDGREVTVPGAQKYEHGIYVPAEAWNGVVQRHLADRDAFSAQRRQLEQQLQERDPARNPVVLQAQETLRAFKELLDKGPVEVAKWLDQYTTNRPLLEAQIQNAALNAQLQARDQGTQRQQADAQVQQLAEALPSYLQQNIDAVISQDPELAELKGMSPQLLEKLWPYAEWLFFEADRDYPEHNLKRGQIVVRPERLKQLLGQQAAHTRELKRLEGAARHNRAATSRTPAKPTVRTRGRPIPSGAREPKQPTSPQEWRDNFMSGDDED